MSRKKRRAKMCLHCVFMDVIATTYPDGMTMEEAGEVMRSLACVTGEILSIAEDKEAALAGFVTVVDEVAAQHSSTFAVGGTVH